MKTTYGQTSSAHVLLSVEPSGNFDYPFGLAENLHAALKEKPYYIYSYYDYSYYYCPFLPAAASA